MQYLFDPKEMERVSVARESFSGRLLSDAQFDEAMAITGIIEREIRKTGAFKEKLADYAYAYARTEKMDAARTDTALRDLFKLRVGRSMNEMREELIAREEKLTVGQKKAAYEYALGVGEMIEKGDKISFHRAFAHQGQELAKELDITDAGAKRLMKEEFKAAEGSEFYEWAKDLEEKFFRPQIEAEKKRYEERSRGSDRSRGNDRDDDTPRRRSSERTFERSAGQRRSQPRARL
mgnify:FL=1